MKMKKPLFLIIGLLVGLALFAAACGSDSDDETQNGPNFTGATASNRLSEVISQDKVVCGSRDALPYFAQVDANGVNQGFDADFCRVVAAAVLGDADKAEFRFLETADRFTALQSGEIDVLIRNTTWTASRDGDEAANFVYTTFYDGQGFMVPASSGITTLEELADASICVASGTTTETNLTAVFGARNINFNPLSFESTDTLRPAYESGQCEAWTSDISQLTGFKDAIEDAGGSNQLILAEVISKEPLGPAVLDGDTQWAQVVRWAVMATIQAWEFGITSQNVDAILAQAEIPSNIANFLGVDNFDPGLNLPSDFAANIIRQVGNYEEIYKRNILGIPLDGSANDLWTNGGLMYTPPFR